MKISIVSGCYNAQNSLPLLFNSLIVNRDYVHEFLVCDDGSVDDTVPLAYNLSRKAPFPMRIFRQTHRGMRLAKSINQGLKEVTGDLIFIVMGDSYLQEQTLLQLHSSYIKGTAGCGMRVNVDGEGNLESYDWRIPDNNSHIRQVDNYKFLTGNSMIAATADLKKIGFWNEKYTGYGKEDYDVYVRLQKTGILLYQYNNVKINHIYHGVGQPDNPANTKLFEEELNG